MYTVRLCQYRMRGFNILARYSTQLYLTFIHKARNVLSIVQVTVRIQEPRYYSTVNFTIGAQLASQLRLELLATVWLNYSIASTSRRTVQIAANLVLNYLDLLVQL